MPDFSYSNDASLLLPVGPWGTDYYVASWPASFAGQSPGRLAVTASEDSTHVTITTRADTRASGDVPAFTSGVPGTIVLNVGDAIELSSTAGDLSGSRVTSDRPVQVIGGHYCALVPEGIAACDHLEESMLPVGILGMQYVITAPAVPAIPGGKEQTIRIIATQPGMVLSYDPPQAGAPVLMGGPGDSVEIPATAASFVLTATHPVLVAQYMEGQDVGGGVGDPSLTLAIPVSRFRTSYSFHAPTNDTANYVQVIAPTGVLVVLDGLPVTGFQGIGATGWSVARFELPNGGPLGGGNHYISASVPFGISVYGYGACTSYWYPGGIGTGMQP